MATPAIRADDVAVEPPGEGHGGARAFDEHRPPLRALVDECVHCGFCLPTCPTYALWREEMDSPRGRIYLMKLALDGQAELSDAFVGHFDACLGCMACVSACPSGVRYDQLIEATRAQIERRYRRPLGDRLFRALVFAIFPHPRRLRALALPLRFYQRSGLRALVRRSGLLRLLPARLRAMEAMLPPLGRRAPRAAGAVGAASGPTAPAPRRPRVGLLLGCVQSVFFEDVNAATTRVLAADGWEVVLPRAQGCCGALALHVGREAEAMQAARQTIDAFDAAGVDVVAVNAAGCGSAMKDYGRLLADDPVYAERARTFAAKCRDISEVLAGDAPGVGRAPRRELPLRVAYHDACHLQHAQGVRGEPRRLLAAIPGLQLVELPDPAICCGSAGVYSLLQPTPARELGDRKAAAIVGLEVDAVATGNPGCALQLRAALERAGRPLPVVHVVQVLDAAVNGTAIGE
jgi:glycolate oxidase iron-sulfur subunit